MIAFAYPWLLLAIALPLLVWWALPPYRETSASVRLPYFGEVADAAGLQPAVGAHVPHRNMAQRVLAPLAWALIVVALARPQYLEPPIYKTEPVRDLLLALDLSQSMDTRDFRNPQGVMEARVQAVREVVGDFVSHRPGDRIGLIVFGDAPYPLAPFTLDHVLARELIEDMVPGMAGASTAMGDAIGLGIKLFENSHASEKVVILLTDGNDTASRMPPLQAAEIAKAKGVVVHTVGIGDPAATGEQKVDLETLRQIAATTGGRYFFGADQNALASIYATLDRVTPHKVRTLSWRPRRELFMWPLGAAVLLLVAYQLTMAAITRWTARTPLPAARREPAA